MRHDASLATLPLLPATLCSIYVPPSEAECVDDMDDDDDDDEVDDDSAPTGRTQMFVSL